MRIERTRPAILRVTLSAYEMAALVAAGRWVAEGANGELSPQLRDQLETVVADYDEALSDAIRDSEKE